MSTIRHFSGFPQRDSYPRVRMTSGKAMSEKSDRMTWRYGWTPRFWKFSKKSVLAFSSRNQIWEGTGGSEEDDLEPWRGFWAGVDLHALGDMVLSIRERERVEHIMNQKRKDITYAWKMHEHVTCKNLKALWIKTLSKPTSTQTIIINHTSKMHETLL